MPQRNVATNFTFEQQRLEINLLASDFWTHKTGTDTAASTYLKHDGTNAFTGQTLAVPNAFTINPNSGGGTVTIAGNLDVTGTTTTVSSANLEVTDKNILIAKGSTSDSQADGAGITIDSATDITWNFVDAKDAWVSSIGVEATTTLKVGGVASLHTAQFTGTTAPSAGSGVEIGAPDANTGQVIVYDRDNSAYKQLNLKGSSVQLYGGTTNALVGTFNSTGLTMESGKTITSSGITVNGNTGIEIAGDNTVLKFTENDANPDFGFLGNAGSLRVQDLTNTANLFIFESNKVRSIKNFDAEGGLDVSGNTTTTGHVSIANDKGIFFDGTTTTNDTIWRNSGENSLSISSRFDVNVFIDSNNDDTNASFTVSKDNTTKASATQLFRIQSDGKVGIGADPDELLHIASTGTAKFKLTDKRTSIADGSQYGVIQFEQKDSNTPGISVEMAAVMTDTTNGATALQFKTGTPSTIDERLRIHSDGQVTIGNDHAGAGTWDGDLVVANSAGGRISVGDTGSGERFDIAANGDINLYSYLNGDGINFHTTDGNGTLRKLLIDANGRVLIGAASSTSSAKLAVNGSITGPEAFFELNRTDDPSNDQNIGCVEFSQGSAASRHAARIVTRRDGGVWGAASLPTRFEFHTCISGTNSPTEKLRIASSGNVLPGSDNSQDLGSTTKRWANVYTGDMHLNNMNTGGNDVDGSEGHWTMQEGADDLFLINRNTGKKYKFNLTEVS